ncbi:NAD(P)H-dependent glycerol-3-phosphate dehydrogenase [Cryptobacterium curtum]|uniref:NAD(P)H-dependent glycerol-3-phosphate dehydrogenase n=1 Tax=Cryptobacterium curtum TaxID=84163 RepID=UPI0028D8F3F1|nr:NAD(P)H-dependent glycerol-3-phosphate dehydrogenase [Cryptobacterium curtum]
MKIGVIGAGSWGTALSQMLATKGLNVNLWARRPEVVASINVNHINQRYFSDVTLSSNIVATVGYEDCLMNAEAIAVVTPSNLLRGVARALAAAGAADDLPIIICSKGVEAVSGLLPTQIFEEEMGNASRLAVLSGPNHAEEVIAGMPAATVIASRNADTTSFLQSVFATENFRTYTSTDVVGVEVCAACKNVIAIAVGLSYGLGYGDNTASLLITRGLAEMGRLVSALGGDALTCMGLAGTGDMIATCMSQHSRNRRFGERLAAGGSLDDFCEETHMVVEGALASKTLLPLAKRADVELPIAEVVRQVVWEGADASKAAIELARRPLREEFYGLS